MASKGFVGVQIKEADAAEVLEIGRRLLGNTGVEVNLPNSIRAMIKALQEEDGE